MSQKNKLHFGPGGIPLSAKPRDTLSGVARVAELGLNHIELEFVYGVRMKEDMAREVGKLAADLGVTITIHAPYYVNLNSQEPSKRVDSIERIINSCRIGQLLGAKSVCFHAAFRMSQEPGQVFDNVLSEMLALEERYEQEGIENVRLAPEVTGKLSQFGDLDELVALAGELKHTGICVDFAHYFARHQGTKNSYDEFVKILRTIKEGLGAENLEKLHMHFSGIDYGAKGERKHFPIDESNFNWRAMLEAIKTENVGGYLVCESPNLEDDALKAQEYYQKLTE